MRKREKKLRKANKLKKSMDVDDSVDCNNPCT